MTLNLHLIKKLEDTVENWIDSSTSFFQKSFLWIKNLSNCRMIESKTVNLSKVERYQGIKSSTPNEISFKSLKS